MIRLLSISAGYTQPQAGAVKELMQCNESVFKLCFIALYLSNVCRLDITCFKVLSYCGFGGASLPCFHIALHQGGVCRLRIRFLKLHHALVTAALAVQGLHHPCEF